MPDGLKGTEHIKMKIDVCSVRGGGGKAHLRWVVSTFGGFLLPLYLINEIEIGEKGHVTPPYGQLAVFFTSETFGVYISKFENNEFHNSWCTFKK